MVSIELMFTLPLIFHLLVKAPVRAGAAPVAVQAALSVQKGTSQVAASTSPSMRLVIPVINVDSAVNPVGVNQDGALEVPKDPGTVGWYQSGPYPGDEGSAVIDGHFGRWADGEGSVFDNLYKLKRGDSLYVKDIKGTATNFVVSSIRVYDSQADASAVFKSDDGLAHLNLITCAGEWNDTTKSYPKRLVIFTDKQMER